MFSQNDEMTLSSQTLASEGFKNMSQHYNRKNNFKKYKKFILIREKSKFSCGIIFVN